MSKNVNKGTGGVTVDLSKYSRSTFTLSFVVEVVGLEVWEDCNEGFLEQGPCLQGLKIQYNLYPGQMFDVDIVIWPHTAKIWCGTQYGWVRSWQFLQRRWLTFSIRHAFPVRVVDLKAFVATITPSIGVAALGSNAKNDKNFDVYLPPLGFGVRRYFGPVLETEETFEKFVQDIIWSTVEKYIPWSYFDGLFDVPCVVSDARHQDACLDSVRDCILKINEPEESEETDTDALEEPKGKEHKEKDKKKVVESTKIVSKKFEIILPGESILAGTGRIVPFEKQGDLPPDSPEIIVLISSNNLPADDDLPIVFVNVENLCQIPLNELKILSITQLYTKWTIGEEEHCSQPLPLKNKTVINFNDHRALLVPCEQLPMITSEFLDNSLCIELRGIRLPPSAKQPKLFGYGKYDRDFGRSVPKAINEELDIIIAQTKIDARKLSKGVNAFIRGEYPLYPPRVTISLLERERYCTNDINSIRPPVKPSLIFRPDIVLQAQMTMEVSVGVVSCKTRNLSECYSRMFCVIKDSKAVMKILRCITEINENIILSDKRDDLLSGFALDTGSIVVLFLEGPKDGYILNIWDMTEDFYPKVKPMFSCSDRYSTRIYPAAVPFVILKMFVPLPVLLACPPVYARPALPLPTRSTVLKIGRLIAKDLHFFPSRSQMPTTEELKSFRLELCVAPRPIPPIMPRTSDHPQDPLQNVTRINWDK